MKLKFIWVDAFTDKKFGGNPCAVVLDADLLTDEQMLAIAKELNLSETALVVQSSKADFGARYFTPAEEIPLAGHPTISTIHALIDSGAISKNRSHITLELKAGVIDIEIIAQQSGLNQIVMSQKKPQFLSTHKSEVIAPLFGLNELEILSGATIQTVSTGTPQLMVPVKNHRVLKRASLNVDGYKAYKSSSDFFSPHLFCLEGVTPEGSTFARHFGVPPDAAEDSFTGSATGGMAAYLWHYKLIKSPKFIAEQGHWMGRPGRGTIEVVGQPDNIETVKVGGSAVKILSGEIEI